MTAFNLRSFRCVCLWLAGCLLKAWDATPVVSAVEIDAASKQVRTAQNTTVTGLAVDGTIAWSGHNRPPVTTS